MKPADGFWLPVVCTMAAAFEATQANLTRVQERCTELLLENRDLKTEIQEMEARVAFLEQCLADGREWL